MISMMDPVINIIFASPPTHVDIQAFVDHRGFYWKPADVMAFARDIVIPKMRRDYIGLPVVPATDALICGELNQIIYYLHRLDVCISANPEDWPEYFLGPRPERSYYFQPVKDFMSFETAWFGNDVKLKLRLGPMVADVFLVKTM